MAIGLALIELYFQPNLGMLSMNRTEDQNSLFQLFEGAWLSSPAGNIAYAKVVRGRLLIRAGKANWQGIILTAALSAINLFAVSNALNLTHLVFYS